MKPRVVHITDGKVYKNNGNEKAGHSSNAKLLDKYYNFEEIIQTRPDTDPNKTLKEIEKIDPDVVLFSIINNCTLELSKKLQKKYVTVLRTSINLIEVGLSNIFRKMYTKIVRGLTYFDILIPSDEVQKKNLETLGHQFVWDSIEPMVEINYFKQFRNNNKKNFIGTVGRHTPIKNMYCNIHICENIFRRIPDTRMLIYNGGKINAQLIKYAKNSGWLGNILFRGKKEKKEIYNKCKVMLSMSINENHSIAVIEARASGIPIICSDISGHKGGIKIPYDNISDASDKLYKLLTDNKYYKEKQEEGYKDLERYKPENIIPKYEKVFECAMGLK